MAAEYGQHGASQNDEQLAHRNLLQGAVEKVIKKKLDEEHYKFIKTEFESDRDKELVFAFHTACRCGVYENELNFIIEVIKECLEWEGNETSKSKPIEGSELLEYLFNLQNMEGLAPFHVALEFHGDAYLTKFLERVKAMSDLAFSILVNVPDSNKWSPIHKILMKGSMLGVLRLVKEKIDWSAAMPGSNATALHLAIYYNDGEVWDIILKDESSNDKSSNGKSIDSRSRSGKSSDGNSIDGISIDGALNTIMKRSIVYGRKKKNGMKRSCEYWSPLQLAAMMGNPYVVGFLLKKIDNIYDSSKRNNLGLSKPENYSDAIPALHLAAKTGSAELIRLFKPHMFDPFMLTSDNRTSIHFATDCSTPKFGNEGDPKVENIPTGSSRFRGPFTPGCTDSGLRSTPPGADEEAWKAGVMLLLQKGVDMWQKDDEGILAGPGSKAPPNLRLWWYEARAKDAQESKKNLNDAANAISVVAALVATASYVGPLQPPLGYGTSDPVQDLVQTTKFLIRLFVVSNCLSFYLAIGSILFAVVPSLPRPHLNVDSMNEEWQRMKRTVCIAILFLLLAIVGVLISFAAASNVGMEDHYSWQHSGLSLYPTILGSLICCFGIVTFFLRLIRLAFERNVSIRHLHTK